MNYSKKVNAKSKKVKLKSVQAARSLIPPFGIIYFKNKSFLTFFLSLFLLSSNHFAFIKANVY
jgi:hypothetical protein